MPLCLATDCYRGGQFSTMRASAKERIVYPSQDESERVIACGLFVLGLTPQSIAASHTALFANAAEVYNVKRYLLGRLRRNKEIQLLIGDDFSQEI